MPHSSSTALVTASKGARARLGTPPNWTLLAAVCFDVLSVHVVRWIGDGTRTCPLLAQVMSGLRWQQTHDDSRQ